MPTYLPDEYHNGVGPLEKSIDKKLNNMVTQGFELFSVVPRYKHYGVLYIFRKLIN